MGGDLEREIDRPLACDASFNDISSSFIILIASRSSGGSLSMAPTSAISADLSASIFAGGAGKGFMLPATIQSRGPLACLPAQFVDDAAIGDGDQPGPTGRFGSYVCLIE